MIIVSIFFVFLVLFDYAHTTQTKEKPLVTLLENTDYDHRANLYDHYLRATYLHAKGDITRSLRTYQALVKHKHPDFIYEGFVTLLADAGLFNVILQLEKEKKETFDTLFKDNVDIKLKLAQAYLHTGNDEHADKLFSQLTAKHPEDSQIAYYTALAYIQKNNLTKAITFLDECIKNDALKQKRFLFHFLKSKVCLSQNKKNEALQEITKSLKLFPKFDRGWLFQALLLEQLGHVKYAIKGYQTFLDIVGRDESVEKQLIKLMFSQQQFEKAADLLKKFKQDNPEYFYDLALVELQAHRLGDALKNVNIALTKSPEFKNARLLKVEILIGMNHGKDALAYMRDWISQNPNDTTTLHMFTLLTKTKIAITDLIATLEELVTNQKTSLGIYSILADLYLRSANYEKALHNYRTILTLTTDNALKSHIYFQIGYINFETKKYNQVENNLRKALEHKPVYPSAYNLLAYFYAQKNSNLEYALKLINSALQASPSCYYYLDTKGYVLLKLGKKQEAIKVLEAALKLAPHDHVIHKHLKAAQNVRD